ncbi:MAG: hypothetical protein J7L66_06420 [Anaerolineaceae bacterium]|nr:hypothetical protein [Anaerolineaceae bacterium]
MMKNDNLHLPSVYSIIGIDLSTHDCADFADFKRLLLTGKVYDNRSAPLHSGSAQQKTHGKPEPDENNPDLLVRRIGEMVKRMLMDAQLGAALLEKKPLSMVIHSPHGYSTKSVSVGSQPSNILSAIKNEIGLNTLQIKRVPESFKSALDKSLSILQSTANTFVALVSTFAYSSDVLGLENHLGMGCILLSRDTDRKYAYAHILWKKPQEPLEKTIPLKETRLPGNIRREIYPHYQSAPIVQMIKSALELSTRTHFSQPFLSSKNSAEADKAAQVSIRPWFSPLYTENREAAVHLRESGRESSTLILTENQHLLRHPDFPLSNFGNFFLPVSIKDASQGLQEIKGLITQVANSHDLTGLVNQSLARYGTHNSHKNTLVVLGSSRQELLDELERSSEGIIKSLKTGKDWQTPLGSFFTPAPLGPHEKIAFVFPGAFSTYIGMGREVFYLFPQLYEKLQAIAFNPADVINESVIFPPALSTDELTQLQGELNRHPIQMISSGVCFSFLYAVILRDFLKVRPDSAFGYSLGENSMMFAMGIWKQADAMRTSLEVSPIFHSRVSGPQNAVREYWKMPAVAAGQHVPPIWANYVLMASPDKVKNAIKAEDRVYITHINTPRQVVIGGDKDACRRIIDTVNCMHLQTPYHHAIHCDAVASEFKGFERLHDWPVENKYSIPVYSAANYAPLEYDSKSIASSFAKMLTNPIDFPRLVNLAYKDGARIFIELGAGSNCSKWVGAILKGKPHAALTINQNNVSDHLSILRLIARLLSHQVSLDLEALKELWHA